MSIPRYGWRYASALPNGTAEQFIVLTEDEWNRVMRDVVVVPIFRAPGSPPNLFRVAIADDLLGLCTRATSLATEFLGEALEPCDDETLTRVRWGVRRYLDIDRREQKRTTPAAKPRAEWWPRQGDFHFARNPQIGPEDKLYASVADNDWNSRAKASYTTCVRLTSRTKSFRKRWEVPVAESFVVAGDLYLITYERFEQRAPRGKYPQRLTADETAEIAKAQKRALSLR